MELQSGKAYVIIVRAINMINLSKNELSNGFTVDATSPVSGRVVIISPSPNKFEINQITARYVKNYKTNLLPLRPANISDF